MIHVRHMLLLRRMAVLLEKHEKHVLSKLATYNERKNDRSSDVPVVCFDLENVISLPHANVSSMFYKRKLSMYNLTGHLSCGKQAYSVLWHEGEAGRGGNDIASALTQMLYAVVKQQPAISELILWADSCVPQNRHSLMSLALIRFLSKQTALQKITQKFCERPQLNTRGGQYSFTDREKPSLYRSI